MNRTLEKLQTEITFESQKGFPILFSGAIVFLFSLLCRQFFQWKLYI